MVNFISNNLEMIFLNVIIEVILILIYDLIRNKGKFYFNLLKVKVNVQNKDSWTKTDKKVTSDTKGIDIDFKAQLYNHRKRYSSIYNIRVCKKRRYGFKLTEIDTPYLNLSETMKSASGATTYEKLKYATLLPFEIREFNIKIKLTKEEFKELHQKPIYICYKDGRIRKKIRLNTYLRRKK